MTKLCVLGSPISHSKSPLLFTRLAKNLELDLDYEKAECSEGQLGEVLRILGELGYKGCNITLPLKEKVLSYLDRVEVHAAALGAVNVIKWQGKTIRGYNTDTIGISETFKTMKWRLSGKRALVFGAGGASLSVCYTLGRERLEKVYICNRTQKKAERIARRMNKLFSDTKFIAKPCKTNQYDLVVNTTPLGLKTHAYKSLLADVQASYAFDLLYHEEMTAFLKEAAKKGMKTVNGLTMFVEQALASYEIWYKKIPGKNQVSEDLQKYLKRTRK